MEHVFNLAERYQCPVFLLEDQMLAQSSYTVPALDPSGFVIDRGKLLTRGAGRASVYDATASTTSATRSRKTASPTASIPGTPGVTNYYTNTNEHTEDGYITEEEVVRQAQMDKRFMQRMELIARRPGAAAAASCTAPATPRSASSATAASTARSWRPWSAWTPRA